MEQNQGKHVQDQTDRNWIRQTGTELNEMDMIRGYRDMVRGDEAVSMETGT